MISGIVGGIGGALSNVVKPLKFCGKGTIEIVKDVTKHWAIGTVADAGTTMLTTYVSDRMDGKSHQEAIQNVQDSAGQIIVESMVTSAAGTFVDSITAPKCFVAGTMIITISGLKAIEQIQGGDLVLAANEETGEVAYKEVVRTFVNTTDEITHVTIENAEGEYETIDSTPEHPFYVEGLGWVEASSLHAGMTIWFADGTKGAVEDISNEGLEEPVTVYNFEVKDFHTYFVGENGVLVHNTCGTTSQTETDTGTVWDDINPTQPPIEGTEIPKSFELTAGEERFWVHPNATKHMGEYLSSNGSSPLALINNQAMLTSFQSAVNSAVEQGITYEQMMTVGGWELIFSAPRDEGLFPVIKHALYLP